MGTFACVGTGFCTIERAMTGETAFMVADVDPNTVGLQRTGQSNWEFTPDPNEMVTVPDQDWMVFGAWLTTPDDGSGTHRLGVFHTGMDEYMYRDNTLTGSATYSGSATGVYADGAAGGLFTARAMLTATFSGANDDMLTGRIDDFRDTRGNFLGSDTATDPNDPVGGGENDWIVMLGRQAITESGAVATNTMVSGSADGVPWNNGEWAAQLYGPHIAPPGGSQPEPSGVTGQFRAEIWTAGTETTDDMRGVATAVVGAFGATNDD